MEEWITEDDALLWLEHTYHLPPGVAGVELKKAFDAGYVPAREHPVLETNDGRFEHVRPRTSVLVSRPVHDHRLRFEELSWQIKQQLGEPPRVKEPKKTRLPDEEANRALLEYADKEQRPLKESDEGALRILDDLGASTRQIKAAFRYLRNERPSLTYGRGKPKRA